jgi:fucose 4-O-acetylase-like acetyltransferase
MKILNALYYPDESLQREGKRVFFWDNLRFILIFLVVQRHFLFRVDQSDYPVITGLYMFFLWFLMPLFVFVTGFYSKSSFDKEGKFRIGRVINFVILYLLLDQLIYLSSWISKGILKGFSFPIYEDWTPWEIPGAQWYMFASAAWFLLIPILRKVSPYIAVPASVVIGITMGYFQWDDSTLALVKIIGFLPFFVLGYYLTADHFTPLLKLKAVWRIAAIIFCLVFAVLVVVFREEVIPAIKSFLEINKPFAEVWASKPYIGPEIWWLLQLGYYAGVTVVSGIVLLVIPTRKTFFTVFGQRTLQIYIIHCVVVRLLKPTGYYDFLNGFPPYLCDLFLFLSALALALLLSWKPLGAPFNSLAKLLDKIRIGKTK